MWIDRLLASRTTRATELAASFAETRHRLLAENLANLDTPDYATKQLDAGAFQDSLHGALQRARRGNHARLDLRDNAQYRTDPTGHVEVRPEIRPAENVLFHDGTNARLERLTTDINENKLYFDLATNFLRGRYQTMLNAIKGQSS
jgi:flagellar basal-body rod protein FlgB